MKEDWFRNPLTGEILTKKNISACLNDIASQEANDGDPYDQMMFASAAIESYEKEVKSLNQLLAVKDEGMKALQEEVDRLTDDLKEIATLIDFKLGYSGYDSDRCKAERDWLMKELVLMVFRECKEPTTKDTLIANIEYSMDNALRGGEDE